MINNALFYLRFIGFCQDNGSYKGCAFEMPEDDDEHLATQLSLLSLDSEEAFNKVDPDLTKADYEGQEWKPPQD